MSLVTSLSEMTREVSMDLDADTASQTRKYPSIRDYYKASSHESDKPIRLQHGLSNYSNLVLGDDRISVAESLTAATLRVSVEEKMAVASPSKQKTKNSRRRDYQEAFDKVGDAEISRLEKVMKDKLIQRSHRETASPFHVRICFKFFDRENSGHIPMEGFTRALEFLGFQFSEMQNMALFAKYDKEYTGEIDDMDFMEKAMFYKSSDVSMPANRPGFGKKSDIEADDLYDVPDMDEAELKALQETELRRVFNKVDTLKRESINKDQFELLLMAMGHKVSTGQFDLYCADLGLGPDGRLSFGTLFEWWTSDVGARFVTQPETSPSSRK